MLHEVNNFGKARSLDAGDFDFQWLFVVVIFVVVVGFIVTYDIFKINFFFKMVYNMEC